MSNKIIDLIKYINTDFKGYLRSELKNKKIPIKTKHAGLFSILYEDDNKVEFKNLVKTWKRSKSTLSETINKYVEAGLLQKEHTPLDKRVVYISLTELGRSYSKDFKTIYSNYSSSLTKNIGKTNEDILNNLLTEVVEGIKSKDS